ncbi:MAG: glycosyltransferase family 2 protein [Pedobacter sp.]|nr:MAG: glycosyltransferase family 2 protein [Pedobacter sp.]
MSTLSNNLNKAEHLEIVYSLLVPVYNAEAYIAAFLEEIKLLRKPFDEIIFYDDASTDATASLLASSGFHVILGKINKGPGYARNRLAEAAQGKYIHFHDVDDRFNPLFLNLLDQPLKNQSYDVILGNSDWLDSNTNNAILRWRYSIDAINKDPLKYFIQHPLGIINTIYKRAKFISTGGFDEQLKCWEDADLHVKLASQHATFAYIDEVLAYSIRHNNGISNNQIACWGCRLKFLALYLAKFESRLYREVIKEEVIKVKNNFLILGAYKELKKIAAVNKEYDLNINLTKSICFYYADNIIPHFILVKLFRLLSSNKI